jgi:hypothetical protein
MANLAEMGMDQGLCTLVHAGARWLWVNAAADSTRFWAVYP